MEKAIGLPADGDFGTAFGANWLAMLTDRSSVADVCHRLDIKFTNRPRHSQHLELNLQIKPAARFDFDNAKPFGNQRIGALMASERNVFSLASRVAATVEMIPPPAREMSS